MNRPPRAVPALFSLLCAGLATAPADAAQKHGQVPGQVIVKFKGERFGRAIKLPSQVGVGEARAALRQNPRVAYAVPNYIATASDFMPNDPGTRPKLRGTPGGWTRKQWNFLPWQSSEGMPSSPGGIDALGAWQNLIAAGRPGAAGIRVAVLDTGVAYRSEKRRRGARRQKPRIRRSPDFLRSQFVRGWDFVNRDRLPIDANGHGTHVAGTIAEATNNGIGVTGLAYRAKLMPVQVLNSRGRGQADDIAKGIRWAAAHGAQVINMSFNFACGKQVPDVDESIRYALERGAVLVASIGNLGSESCISPPATEAGVIGVGGTTEGGCLGSYSLAGPGVDLVAPGGGTPEAGCPSIAARPIYQVTFKPRRGFRFGLPSGYVGTSMAAAHVSGVAAMVLAVLPRPALPQLTYLRVTQRLTSTARDIGASRLRQGAGLIDAARATAVTVRSGAAR